MTHIPTITREARDWLLNYVKQHQDVPLVMRDILDKMPLAPADPLDAIRARFGPKTRAGYDYKIFAEWDDHLWGVAGGTAVCWTMEGKCESAGTDPYGLLPASPHAALIAQLNEAYTTGINDPDLYKRAADALEKLP